ncbi:OmpP1/FadL family transporter [Pseudomonas sp. 5P_3.1_Bac2]|uniref:OmpP1/FadL family transporter n=1 Tax=Pseudomonas sp. 5P_3.1_Bac2 TaxID=2971617 RepID=UPI0021C9085F|nr:outer membrane protein transport protein [Pseudomonas sp. 5P_3.1_Bac2]MCU1716258.1 outer membrane protein transport protein [Pseudomonas sp. 5P_3.1_Bac2]
MPRKIVKTCLSIAIATAASQTMAGGFALNEQSISGMGTSFAGRSSSADDATTVASNPAGMSRLKREQISVGAAVLFAKSDISKASGVDNGTNHGDMVPVVGVPMGYYVKPLNEDWTFGLGMYVPFGLMTDYEGSFQGRYHGKKSQVQVLTLQPTLSYRFNEQFSIGFGPTINRVDGELTSAVKNPIASAGDGEVKVKGDDTAVGYNIGMLYEFTPETRAGITYHSKVKYRLKGHTTMNGGGFIFQSSAGKYDGSLRLTTPESVDFSLTHDINDRWTVYAGSTWTRWSRFQEIKVQNDDVQGFLTGPLTTITEEQNWHDTWSHAIGAAYKLNKEWTLRTGFAVDQSPTNNTDRAARMPTGDRKAVSLGAAWSPNDDITVDLAYSYLREEKVKVDSGDYRADFRNSAHGLGAQLTYRF